jgi:hypothetical protein
MSEWHDPEVAGGTARFRSEALIGHSPDQRRHLRFAWAGAEPTGTLLDIGLAGCRLLSMAHSNAITL